MWAYGVFLSMCCIVPTYSTLYVDMLLIVECFCWMYDLSSLGDMSLSRETTMERRGAEAIIVCGLQLCQQTHNDTAADLYLQSMSTMMIIVIVASCLSQVIELRASIA